MYYHTHVCSVVVCTSGVWLLEFLKNYQFFFVFFFYCFRTVDPSDFKILKEPVIFMKELAVF
jgi:hypothetical protein